LGQRLRTATPMADWRSFPFTVTDSAGHQDGDLVLVNDTVGFVHLGKPQLDHDGCVKDPPYQLGDEALLIYHAEKCWLDKDGNAALLGGRAYWSGVNGDPVTSVWQSGYYWIGIFVRAAAAGDAEVYVDLKGDKATIGA